MNNSTNTFDRYELVELAMSTMSIMLDRDQTITFLEWADKIEDFYDKSDPKTAAVLSALRSFKSKNHLVHKNRFGSVKVYI